MSEQSDLLRDFLKLKDKINSGKTFVCFTTKNGRRFITTCIDDKKLKILSEKLEVIPTDKDYTEPFDLIRAHKTYQSYPKKYTSLRAFLCFLLKNLPSQATRACSRGKR